MSCDEDIKAALERVTAVWGGAIIEIDDIEALTHGEVVEMARAAGADDDQIAAAIGAARGAVK